MVHIDRVPIPHEQSPAAVQDSPGMLLNAAGVSGGQKAPMHAKVTPGVVNASCIKLNVAPWHESGSPLQLTEPLPLPKLNIVSPLHASGKSQYTVKSVPLSQLKDVPLSHAFSPIQLTVNAAPTEPIIVDVTHPISSQFTKQSNPSLLHATTPSLQASDPIQLFNCIGMYYLIKYNI